MVRKKHLSSLLSLRKNLRSICSINHYVFGDYRRVYHYHIMKTGGTSINHMFLALSGDDPSNLYTKLMNSSDGRIIEREYVYVAWNQLLVRLGLFSYAWSHRPYYKTWLPRNCYSITCIRHPYERLYSRYKHIHANIRSGRTGGHTSFELECASGTFSDYLSVVPDSELCHQLCFFSSKKNIDEAIYNLSKVDLVMMLPTLDADVRFLNEKLGLNLECLHVRKVSGAFDGINGHEEFSSIKDRILPELEFFERAVELRNTREG